jgi:hypothetical protein
MEDEIMRTLQRAFFLTSFFAAFLNQPLMTDAADAKPILNDVTFFSVSVMEEAAAAFMGELQKNQQIYNSSDCRELYALDTDHITQNFPRPREDGEKNYYRRLFYRCPNTTVDTYKMFGDASLAASRASWDASQVRDKSKDPPQQVVRVISDTVSSPQLPASGNCNWYQCGSGTPQYIHMNNPPACIRC